MKKIMFLGVAICLCAVLNAQKVYFMYFQSESAAPFYLKMAGKVHSSTAQGYLILSMLKDSTYSFQIGQPGGRQDEPKYSVTINKADKGFLLKNTDGQINLFDLQTLAIYKPLPNELNSERFIKKNDKFSVLLAMAADDPSIMYEEVAVKTENVVASSEPVVAAKETFRPRQETSGKASVAPVMINRNEEAAPEANNSKETAGGPESSDAPKNLITGNYSGNVPANEPMSIQAQFIKSVITKKSESSTSEGFGLVYLDITNGVVDTVRLLIPNQKFIFSNGKKEQSVSNVQFLDISVEQDAAPVQPSAVISGSVPSVEKDVVAAEENTASQNNDEQAMEDAKSTTKSKVPSSDKKGI